MSQLLQVTQLCCILSNSDTPGGSGQCVSKQLTAARAVGHDYLFQAGEIKFLPSAYQDSSSVARQNRQGANTPPKCLNLVIKRGHGQEC
jgi:hypothetical protein